MQYRTTVSYFVLLVSKRFLENFRVMQISHTDSLVYADFPA